MTTVSVERQSPDGLSAQRWKFRIEAGYGTAGIFVRMETYYEVERPTRRHHFRPIVHRSHDQLGRYNGKQIPEHEVPLPPDVTDEAVALVQSQVRFIHPEQPQAAKAT